MVEWAWNIELVEAPAALERLPKAADGHIDWGDIKLCHLDTGYTDHPVFRDPVSGQTWLRIDEGKDFIDGGTPEDPVDDPGRRGKSFGHGTRTGSVICGGADRRDDDQLLNIGAAPRLPLVPCRVVNWVVLAFPEDCERVAAGIRHAILSNCQIVSMSLGGLLSNKAMNEAIIEAYKRGIILVAAAGQETDRVTFPGRYVRTITCAAVGQDKVPWRKQFWKDHPHEAERIDVWAPGDDVPVATRPTADTGGIALSNFFDSASSSSASKGSSYATAHVAAAAAIWLRHRAADLETAYGATPSWHRVEAFRTLLKASKSPLSGLRPPNGSGLLNIRKLLEAPLPAAETLHSAASGDRH
jgi:subtilisin family serine protease